MTYVPGRAGHSGYELRVASYMQIVVPLGWGPYSHGSCSTEPGYWCETDTPLDQEDRANTEDCWRDWWKTGRAWIRPEPDDDDVAP